MPHLSEIDSIFGRVEQIRSVPVTPIRNRKEGVEDLLSPQTPVSGTEIPLDQFLNQQRAEEVLGRQKVRLPRVSRLWSSAEKDVGERLHALLNRMAENFKEVSRGNWRRWLAFDKESDYEDMRNTIGNVRKWIDKNNLHGKFDRETAKLIKSYGEELNGIERDLNINALEMRMHRGVSGDRTSIIILDRVDRGAVLYHEGSLELRDRYLHSAIVLSHPIDVVFHPLPVREGEAYFVPPSIAYRLAGEASAYRVIEWGLGVELPERTEQNVEVMYAQKGGAAELNEPNLLPLTGNPIRMETVEVETIDLPKSFQRKTIKTGDLGGVLWVTSGEVAMGIRDRKPMTLLPGKANVLFRNTEFMLNPVLRSQAVFLRIVK